LAGSNTIFRKFVSGLLFGGHSVVNLTTDAGTHVDRQLITKIVDKTVDHWRKSSHSVHKKAENIILNICESLFKYSP